MKIVFNNYLPDVWLYIIIILFISYSSFLIWKYKSQWLKYLLLIIFRLTIIILILLYFYKPAIQYDKKTDYIPLIPIIIDNSYSMRSDWRTDEKRILPKYQYYQNIIKKYFINNHPNRKQFKYYFYSDKKLNQYPNPESPHLPIGITDINHLLTQMKEDPKFTSPVLFLVSDLNLHLDSSLLKGFNKKIYVLYAEENILDTYIQGIDVQYNDSNALLSLNLVNTSNIPEIVSLYIYNKEEQLYTKDITLSGNLIIHRTSIKRSLDKDIIIKCVLKNKNRIEKNDLNNVYYLKIDRIQMKSTVHLVFNKPSFELSFLHRFLKRQNKYLIKNYLPKSDSPPIQLRNISTRDKIILGNIDSITPQNIQSISRFVKDGGLLIFLKGSSDLRKLFSSSIESLLSFQYRTESVNNKKSAKLDKDSGETSDTRNNTIGRKSNNFILTLNQQNINDKYFLTFRNTDNPQLIWNDLPIFSKVEGNIIPLYSNITLATINNTPAILYRNMGIGTIISILIEPIWKIDFFNLNFGIHSEYYDQFWDELLQMNNEQVKESPLSIAKDICEYGDENTLYIDPMKIKDPKNLFIIGKKNENDFKIPLKISKNEKNLIKYSVQCNHLGSNKIVLAKEESSETLAEFYVNYPLKESFQNNNELRYAIAKDIADNTNGKIIKINELNQTSKSDPTNKSLFSVKREIEHKIIEKSLVHNYIYILIVIFLLIIEWLLKRKFIGN